MMQSAEPLIDTICVWMALFWQWMVQSESWIEIQLANLALKHR